MNTRRRFLFILYLVIMSRVHSEGLSLFLNLANPFSGRWILVNFSLDCTGGAYHGQMEPFSR
jgi:hypothetical protein